MQLPVTRNAAVRLDPATLLPEQLCIGRLARVVHLMQEAHRPCVNQRRPVSGDVRHGADAGGNLTHQVQVKAHLHKQQQVTVFKTRVPDISGLNASV